MNKRFIKVLSEIVILAIAAALVPRIAHGGNAGNFVLYNHHTPEAGEMEIMLMIDIGQQPDGIRYTAQMAEFRLASTDKFITEFMIEGQTTSGEDGYNFTGQGRSAGVRLRQHLPARRRHVLRRTDLDASKLAWIPKT